MVQLCPLIFAAIVSAKHTPIQAEALKEKLSENDLNSHKGLKNTAQIIADERRRKEKEREKALAEQEKLAEERAKNRKPCVALHLMLNPVWIPLGEFEKDEEKFVSKGANIVNLGKKDYNISFERSKMIMNGGEPTEFDKCSFKSESDDMTKLISGTGVDCSMMKDRDTKSFTSKLSVSKCA